MANDGGLPAGTALACGLVLLDRVPQGHKVALVDLSADAPVLRYGMAIGYALKDIAAGSWVHERLLKMPDARARQLAYGDPPSRSAARFDGRQRRHDCRRHSDD